jgi:hypothetical protein
MSLDVSPELLAQAEAGPVPPDAFLDTVRTSLPYAYAMVERLTKELAAGADAPFADNVLPPESEAERGQLLRAPSRTATGWPPSRRGPRSPRSTAGSPRSVRSC